MVVMKFLLDRDGRLESRLKPLSHGVCMSSSPSCLLLKGPPKNNGNAGGNWRYRQTKPSRLDRICLLAGPQLFRSRTPLLDFWTPGSPDPGPDHLASGSSARSQSFTQLLSGCCPWVAFPGGVRRPLI